MIDVREAKERLKKQLDASLAVESVGSLIKCADLALLLASHDALEEALRALANAADNVGIAFFDSDDMPAEAEAMQAATLDARAQLKEAGQSGADLLQWLIEHTDLELSFRHSDDPDEGVWCVYRRQGSANDREWCLFARGQTPWQALFLARALLKEDAQ